MDDDKIIEKIKLLLSQTLRLSSEKIFFETNVFTELGADSLDILSLATKIENEFGISVDDIENLVSIKKIYESVKEKLKI